MKIDKETQEKIQELQILEQNLQQVLMQKQAFQMELSEASNALAEVSKSSEAIYKIVGNVMIKTEKKEIEKELQDKNNILNLKLKSIDRQEAVLTEKTEKFRQELLSGMKKE